MDSRGLTREKGRTLGAKREKGKGMGSRFRSILTYTQLRAHARTKRNDFPVGLSPPTSDILIDNKRNPKKVQNTFAQ